MKHRPTMRSSLHQLNDLETQDVSTALLRIELQSRHYRNEPSTIEHRALAQYVQTSIRLRGGVYHPSTGHWRVP